MLAIYTIYFKSKRYETVAIRINRTIKALQSYVVTEFFVLPIR